MKNLSVIFDTNAYREFSYYFGGDFSEIVNNMEKLVYIERKKEIEAYISPPVLLELFSHLANPNDRAYKNCKYSVIASYIHSKFQESDDYRILADSESTLAKLLFNYEDTALIQKWKVLGNYAYQIFINEDESNINKFRKYFELIAEYVGEVEEQFLSDIFNFVVLRLNPSAINWKPLINEKGKRKAFLNYLNSGNSISGLALMQVYKACNIAKIDPRKIKLDNYTDKAKNAFSAALTLFNEILKRIAESGCNLRNKNRRNWIWDIQILFSVTNNTLNNKNVMLITTDRDMLKAAQDVRLGSNVLRLKEYLNSIGFN